MQLFKKIIRNTLLVIISIIAAFLIIGMLNGKYNFLGYNEVDHFNTHFAYKAGYFKDSVRGKIVIKSLKKNMFNDSMYSINYGDSCNILIWIIKQNQKISLNAIIDTNQKALKPGGASGTFYTYPDSKLTIQSSLFLHDLKNAAVQFSCCKNLQNIIHSNKCQYYYLKPGTIYLTSDNNKSYDIDMSFNIYSDANFMVYTMNNKLYIFLLYSTYKIKISRNALSDIINLPLT